MEVNRENYLQVLPEILQKLENAAFVSFDAEYTGLKCDDGETTSLFDNVSERYEKLRRVALTNSAPQFGLGIFQRVNDSNKPSDQIYSVDAYCLYVAEPCFAGFNMEKCKASVEIDCCQFLKGIKFDFEKWFKDSVPYLNKSRIMELRAYLDQNPNFMKICERDKRSLDKVFFPQMIPDLTEEDKTDIIARLRGFSTIVDVISHKRIPVVGHNMIMDLMYFFHQFCEDLPEKYADFKARVAEILPVMFDTKYMTVRCRKMLDHPSLGHSKKDIEQLQCSGLYIIYNTSCAVEDKFSPKFILSENCQYFENDLKQGKINNLEDTENFTLCHQPSFDACVTGIVFLNIAHIAGRMRKDLLDCAEPPTMEDVMFGVRHWQDQIFIARATVNTMCLKGDDNPRPSKCWVKVSSPDGKEIKAEEIVNRLKLEPINGKHGIDYQQTNPTEILLAMTRVDCSNEICAKLKEYGFQASRVMIPWDKKRFESIRQLQTDLHYDTGRNTFFT